MAVTALLTAMREHFFVYGHINEDGQLFYVGCGSISRAFSNAGRTEPWHAHCLTGVVLLHKTQDRNDALSVERDLIEWFTSIGMPLVNCMWGPQTHPNRGRPSKLKNRAMPAEQKAKIAAALKGKRGAIKGRPKSADHAQRIKDGLLLRTAVARHLGVSFKEVSKEAIVAYKNHLGSI